ncbi:MAG TPA: gluconate 2-dehydrogenase subunit 3 family protein [Hanamia sp.]|nr:gluconate 2-dehydrogenase subunit 3 family protein [Hanamia sp.]
MAVMLPMVVVSTEMSLSSCNTTDTVEEGFTEVNIQLLNKIGETVIPATATSPGAKAARVGQFMKVYVTDCYDVAQQKIFWTGINRITCCCWRLANSLERESMRRLRRIPFFRSWGCAYYTG